MSPDSGSRPPQVSALVARAAKADRLSFLLDAALRIRPANSALLKVRGALDPPPGALELASPAEWLRLYRAAREHYPYVCVVEQPRRTAICVGLAILPDLVLTSTAATLSDARGAVVRFPPLAPRDLGRGAASAATKRSRTAGYSVRQTLAWDDWAVAAEPRLGVVELRFAGLPFGAHLNWPGWTTHYSVPILERSPMAGDLLVSIHDPLREDLGLSVLSVTTVRSDSLILRASAERSLTGAPCFTPDGKLAAIIVELGRGTAVAVPASQLVARLRLEAAASAPRKAPTKHGADGVGKPPRPPTSRKTAATRRRTSQAKPRRRLK